jgi:hypothetical protein
LIFAENNFVFPFPSSSLSSMRCISDNLLSSNLTVLLLTSNSFSNPLRKTVVLGFKRNRVSNLSRIFPENNWSSIKNFYLIDEITYSECFFDIVFYGLPGNWMKHIRHFLFIGIIKVNDAFQGKKQRTILKFL